MYNVPDVSTHKGCIYSNIIRLFERDFKDVKGQVV